MKPIVLTHNVLEASWTEHDPVIITWDGVVMPQELRRLEPGQYVLVPYSPPPEDPPTTSHLAA